MKVYKYGDNVDTDVIIPARHLNTPVPEALASHCMEDIDADFAPPWRRGDIMVAVPISAAAPPGSTRPWPSSPAGEVRHRRLLSPASSTATPSTSASPSWSARRRRRSRPGDQVEVDFATGVITDETLARPTRPRPSRRSSTASLKNGGLLNSLKRPGGGKMNYKKSR